MSVHISVCLCVTATELSNKSSKIKVTVERWQISGRGQIVLVCLYHGRTQTLITFWFIYYPHLFVCN